jgi:hypothetical protein
MNKESTFEAKKIKFKPALASHLKKERIVLPTHVRARAIQRSGEDGGEITPQRIEKLVKLFKPRMKKEYEYGHNRFMIHSTKDNLNIPVEVNQTPYEWRFAAKTVMVAELGEVRTDAPEYRGQMWLVTNESLNLMTFESFMEISQETKNYYDYREDVDDEDGTYRWTISISEEGISDEIVIEIQHIKNPITGKEKNAFKSLLEDIGNTLGALDSTNGNQIKNFYKNFDFRKWQSLIDIAEVSMSSKRHGYEATGYGKNIAMKLLRTRFKIIQEWVAKNKPDFFISLPKKDSKTDTRRLRIYEAYFKRYLSDYEVYAQDASDIEPWGWDTIVCVNNKFSQRMLQSLENDIEDAIYR